MLKSNKMESELMQELIAKICKQKLSGKSLQKAKYEFASKAKVSVPTDIDILMSANQKDYESLKHLLMTKITRTLSGVAVCAIMSKPYPCPHGECSMCPSLTSVGVPQSYTGKEPATRRGIRNNFDPYLQILNRLEQYIALGHDPSKVEMIVMGGTFPSFNKTYQENFIRYAFKALNDFGRFYTRGKVNIVNFKKFFELPGDVESKSRELNVKKKMFKLKSLRDNKLLEQEQRRNENANIRGVALCIETRPDYSDKKHIDHMLKLGTTRVELGVQSVHDKVLKNINRGHDVFESIKATRLLKDSFLKVGYHMMLGLPGSTKKMDVDSLKKIVSDANFMPDALKIYPCMVLKDSEIYADWKAGKFKPLTTDEAANLIAEFKRYVPPFIRIMRVQRDIPTYAIEDGVDRTNLRQYVDKIIKKKHIECQCIRCRESGMVYKNTGKLPQKISYDVIEYVASGGNEFFIRAIDLKNNILLGFCRLRFPGNPFRKEITKTSAGIRELHVFGSVVGIGKHSRKKSCQHKGIGKHLLGMAEKIAKKHGKDKMLVISGIGVREYYRKLGYRKDGVYMSKKL